MKTVYPAGYWLNGGAVQVSLIGTDYDANLTWLKSVVNAGAWVYPASGFIVQ